MSRPDGVPADVWDGMTREMQIVAQDLESQGVPLDTSVAASVVLVLALADTIAITPDDFVPVLGFVDEAALWSTGGYLASQAAQGNDLETAVMDVLP